MAGSPLYPLAHDRHHPLIMLLYFYQPDVHSTAIYLYSYFMSIYPSACAKSRGCLGYHEAIGGVCELNYDQ